MPEPGEIGSESTFHGTRTWGDIGKPFATVPDQAAQLLGEPLKEMAAAIVRPWQDVADALAASWQQIAHTLASQWQETMAAHWQEMVQTYREQLEHTLATATGDLPSSISAAAARITQQQQEEMAPLIQQALQAVAAQAADASQALIEQINVVADQAAPASRRPGATRRKGPHASNV
jgi:type VI protein secretion system component VasF